MKIAPGNEETKVRDAAIPRGQKIQSFKRSLEKWYDSKSVQISVYVMLFIALFAVDLYQVLEVPDSWNTALYSILLFIFIAFIFEILIQCWTKWDEYFERGTGFYFWTDFIGTGSMIVDIPWIIDLGENSGDATLLRASRTARIGARVARLLKLTRAVKLIQAKQVQSILSAISNVVTNSLSKKSALTIMLMVMTLPLLTIDIIDTSPDAFLLQFDSVDIKTESDIKSFQATLKEEFWDFFRSNYDTPTEVILQNQSSMCNPLSPELPNVIVNTDCSIIFQNPDKSQRRSNIARAEFQYKVQCKECTGSKPIIWMNRQDEKIAVAWLNIGTIILVVVFLVGFSTLLNRIITKLVIRPMERIFMTISEAMEGAFETNGAIQSQSSATTTEELEKMVDQLARVIKANSGGDDFDNVDDEKTKEWLKSYKGNVQKKNKTKTRRRTSIMVVATDPNDPDNLNDSPINSPSSNTTQVFFNSVPHATFSEMSLEEQKTIKDVESWDMYCPLDIDTKTLQFHCLYMVENFGFLEQFNISPLVFSGFARQIEAKYKSTNIYHNFYHGVDVMQALYVLMKKIGGALHVYSDLNVFVGLVSALSHDVAHPGYNNSFLITTGDDLALNYNDKSVLENMHCSIMFMLMKNPKFDVFGGLEKDEKISARKIAIEAILATDMAHHFKQVADLAVLADVHAKQIDNGETVFGNDEKSGRLITGILLHTADIANVCRTWEITKQHAARAMEEFFRQGDKEKSLNLPISPGLFDRETVNIPKSQIGFIEFVVSPLISTLFKFFPLIRPILGGNLVQNHQNWIKEYLKSVDEETRDKETAGLEARALGIKKKLGLEEKIPLPTKRESLIDGIMSKRS